MMPLSTCLLQRRGEPRMAVPERVDGDAGERVEVALAGLVPQPDAFAAHERDRLPGVGVHDVAHGALPKWKTAANAAVS